MSNQAFDTLCKKQEVQNAKRTIAEYQGHLTRPDLSNEDRKWLEQALEAQTARLEHAKIALTEWWA